MKNTSALGFAKQYLAAWLITFSLTALFVTPAFSQDAPAGDDEEIEMTEEEAEELYMNMIEEFGWEREGVGQIGNMAEIIIPEGYRFTGKKGTEKLMEFYGNPLTHQEQGTIGPENLDWCVVFEFDKTGYVKDDDKDDIDEAEILKVFKKGQEEDNKRRRQAGVETLTVVGWATKPFYNEKTNNLEWALDLRTESGESVINYRTKLLGRYGVMESTLICSGDQLNEILPTYQDVIKGYIYKKGNRYSEFQQGDKIAQYGLTGLIVGGGIFAAAKLGLFGLLKKFWYVVVAGIAGIGGFIKRLFGGGKRNEYTIDQ